MELTTVWFVLVAVMWVGYFTLEGFDFGVGMLLPVLARDDTERRVMYNTVGPVWDGNEVWLLSAVGGTFAAFPDWYAGLLSGFYLPFLAMLVCLIVRGVAFEYRHKRSGERWQRRWEQALFTTSTALAFLWGLVFADVAHGVPIDARGDYAGSVLDLLNPYALLGGATTLVLFTFHGTVFAALKTEGDIRARARRLAARLGIAATVLVAAALGLLQAGTGTAGSLCALVAAVAALLGAVGCNRAGREGWAFALSGVAVAAVVGALFAALFPYVLPSSLHAAWGLTASSAASSPYTLRIMTWCAGIATPVVLLYQGWTYWVFRKRIGTRHLAADQH
jgi:cytochrome bd ubiquinol oxidase subunit II